MAFGPDAPGRTLLRTTILRSADPVALWLSARPAAKMPRFASHGEAICVPETVFRRPSIADGGYDAHMTVLPHPKISAQSQSLDSGDRGPPYACSGVQPTLQRR